MDNFLQQLINGLTLGSIYGLIAIGYTMVFGIIGMVNFAHGDVFMLSAFIALIIFMILTQILHVGSLPLAFIVVLIGAMALTALWNWAIERLAYRPLRGSFRLAPLISAIGMSIFLSNFVQVVQGPRNKPAPQLPNHVFKLSGDVTLSVRQILIVVITVILLAAFWYLVQFTSLGRAQRACEQDRKMAALLGIDVDATISITFVIGAALAAVAGVMFVIYYGVVNFADGFVPGVKAFTAAVLGGIGSLPGAVLGGLLIGLIEVFWSSYFTTDYKDVAAFMILAITLIFMPSAFSAGPKSRRSENDRALADFRDRGAVATATQFVPRAPRRGGRWARRLRPVVSHHQLSRRIRTSTTNSFWPDAGPFPSPSRRSFLLSSSCARWRAPTGGFGSTASAPSPPAAWAARWSRRRGRARARRRRRLPGWRSAATSARSCWASSYCSRSSRLASLGLRDPSSGSTITASKFSST